MLKKLTVLPFVFSMLVAANVSATQCPTHYLGGRAPEFINTKLAASTKELCFEVFGVMHSGITK